MRKVIVRLISVLLIVFAVTGCTQWARQRPESAPPKPPVSSTVSAEDKKKIRLHLAHEEYIAALDMMKKKIASGASEQNFNSLYVGAVNGLISQGDKHLENNQQAEAGMAFRQALDNYPVDEVMRSKVKQSAPDIQQTIDRVSTSLMDTALMKYREGALEEAIALWDKILVFDPQNAEAKKARDTAATQLENLKKMK